MGLTVKSVGKGSMERTLKIQKTSENEKVIAVAGNPNVGKSTVFNNLTGMNQHTGNWPGKTVCSAQGAFSTDSHSYILVDIPGTYSLMAHSAEEEVARNYICFGGSDAVLVVCDASCLERNLNLVLQTMEITDNVILCVNLLDEAKRKNISVDLQKLSDLLGVPVVGTIARKKKSLVNLKNTLDKFCENKNTKCCCKVKYIKPIEEAIAILEPTITEFDGKKINSRWLALKLIENNKSLIDELESFYGKNPLEDEKINNSLSAAFDLLLKSNITSQNYNDKIVACIMKCAEDICNKCVVIGDKCYNKSDRKIDKILTGKITGYPVMILLLALVLWITVSGANYPSQLLSEGLFFIQDKLWIWYQSTGLPLWLGDMLILGVYKVTAWVVSVMLPPMAIFFPLFTLLEDIGYLPRIAYNLDKPFKKCSACGKQALTTCMGFGCNAAGVVGCRIIDSPRERLIAILTNSFVPCNGRFPTLIALITMFFIGTLSGFSGSVLSALILTGFIILSILMTFAASKFLSKTFLKGMPSSFTLELPSYRRPQIGKIIVRSIFDRTLFVLGRAVAVAAPAGLLIWASANIYIGDASILKICADFLNPFAKLIGLDGIILIAFILGFPANETVIPIIIMGYLAQGSLSELSGFAEMKALFIQNGWTITTAICTAVFMLMHWPCSTTILTVYKETKSVKWTLLAFLLPTICGLLLCFIIASIMGIFI